MRLVLLAASTVIAATLSLSCEAAQPTAPTAAAGDLITFEQYRDWRLNFIERRQGELTHELSSADLSAVRKARLEHAKAYYDWLAGLPEADRDRRFRERFDRIDGNHDGTIDGAERAAWREKQRAFYRRDPTPPAQHAEAVAK